MLVPFLPTEHHMGKKRLTLSSKASSSHPKSFIRWGLVGGCNTTPPSVSQALDRCDFRPEFSHVHIAELQS